MITLNYSPEGYTGAHVEMRVPDNSMNVDEVLDYFERFLIAAGYHFDKGDHIRFISDYTPAEPETISFNYGAYDFGDNSPVFCGSGVVGGMGQDTITFQAAQPVTIFGGESKDTISFNDHLWG
jgi:hypothetical protein